MHGSICKAHTRLNQGGPRDGRMTGGGDEAVRGGRRVSNAAVEGPPNLRRSSAQMPVTRQVPRRAACIHEILFVIFYHGIGG